MTWTRSDRSHRSSWTQAQIRAARQTPLKPVLERLGYRLEPRQDGNYLVLGLSGDVVVKQHYWVRLDNGQAGNAIDFFVKLQCKTFAQTMRLLGDPTSHSAPSSS